MGRRVRASAPLLDTTPFTPALITVPDVEILEVGEDWATSTGTFSFSAEELVSAIESQQDPAVRTPILKLGHTDPRPGFDGTPALGRLENLRLTNNGNTLVCDLVGVPQWLGSIMWSAYPRRSIEGVKGATTQTGHTWPFVLEALSLLGETYPAINTLDDLKALWGATPPVLLPDGNVTAAPVTASADDARVHAERVAPVVRTLPLAPADTPWDPVAAAARVAGDGRAYLSRDLLFADVIDGQLMAVPAAVLACADAVHALPTEEEAVKRDLEPYLTTMGATPPWRVAASSPRPVAAAAGSVTMDDIRSAFYDSLGAAQMWWWIRQMLANPLQLVVDDDEGGLYVVDVTVAADGTISFGEPAPVKVEYVAAAKQNGVARPGQIMAASFSDADSAGARPRATLSPDSTPEEEPSMKLTPEALAALGLPPDASEADINAAIVARATVTEEPGTEPTPTPEPTPAPQPEPTPETPAEPQTPAEPTGFQVPEGMELIDSATATELRELVAAGRAQAAERANAERDRLIGEAVKAGKFPRSRVEHYTTLYNADPEGTRQILASLAPGVIPVTERGMAGQTDAPAADQGYPKAWSDAVAASKRRTGTSLVKVGND